MMMGGFGALKAMNDTIKLNREMLKANKRKSFDRNSLVIRDKTHHAVKEEKVDEAVIKLVRSSAIRESRADFWRGMLALALSATAVVVIILVVIGETS